jgi:hypothetical protein
MEIPIDRNSFGVDILPAQLTEQNDLKFLIFCSAGILPAEWNGQDAHSTRDSDKLPIGSVRETINPLEIFSRALPHKRLALPAQSPPAC